MHVRRILTGPGASSFLPFAMSQIKRLRRLHGDRFWHRWTLPGYFIEVQQTTHVCTIRIKALGSFYLEFQTTGFPIGTSSGFFGVIPEAATVSVVPNNKGDTNSVILDGKRVVNTGTSAPLHRSQQIQLLDEPTHYFKKEAGVYDHVIYDSWAPGSSHSGMAMPMYYPAYHPWTQEIHRTGPDTLRDTQYDVPFGDTVGKNAIRYATLRNGTVDWPRSSMIRTVVDGARTREFVIYVDAFDQVSAFPTSRITTQTYDSDGQPLQNVSATYVQTTRVSFPSWTYKKTERFIDWVTANPGDGGTLAFPEYDWQLHPDGTKMCSVVYARDEALFDSTFYGGVDHALSGGIEYTFFTPTATNWDVTNQFVMGAIPEQGPLSLTTTRYMCATGLLEVDINISLTGDADEDFTLTLVVHERRNPSLDSLCTLLAGYSYQDVPQLGSPTVLDAARGDLCVLDVEVYGQAVSSGHADTMSFLSLKNFTASKEIRAFNAENDLKSVSALVTSGMNQIAAHDMRTLSFAIIHVYDQHQYKSGGTYSDGPPPGPIAESQTRYAGHKQFGHFGVGIYTLNRHRHTFYPTTMDATIQAKIEAMVQSDGRQVMLDTLGNLPLMPVNDIRDWTDSTLLKLRHYYDTVNLLPGSISFPAGPPTTSLPLSIYTSQMGMSYNDSTLSVANPTAEEANWFYEVMSQGRSYAVPWAITRISNPLPGWYLYMDQLMHRFKASPFTAFFTHPNGSWAFHCADLIYNKGGFGYEYDGVSTVTCAVDLDAANFEHCRFDRIYVGGTTNMTLSFLGCYNDAVAAGVTDATVVLDEGDLVATFTDSLTDDDPVDSSVVDGALHIDWGGFQAKIIDPAYFSGDKVYTDVFNADWDPRDGGYLFRPCMSQLWLNEAATTTVEPDLDAVLHKPTFSSLVMIDG